MSDPSDSSSYREDNGKHAGRYTHGFKDDTRVKIDVRVELLLNKIRVFQGDLFESLGDFEEGIIDSELGLYFVGCLLHNLGPRIEVFVDSVPKSHQPERVIFIFCSGDKLVNPRDVADFCEHIEHGFVGATM